MTNPMQFRVHNANVRIVVRHPRKRDAVKAKSGKVKR
jgi:hypothetical protein